MRMSDESPGVVFVKTYSSSAEKPINILKRGQQLLNGDTLPSVITSKGLDVARQWYLYDEIGLFCISTSDNLQSCPKPVSKTQRKENVQSSLTIQRCETFGLLCT